MNQKGLLLIGAAVALFFFKKNTAVVPPPAPPVDTTSDADSLGQQVFEQMSNLIESDPVFISDHPKVFPQSFFTYVDSEYQHQKAGFPRDPAYAVGLPGAFMSVADAWMSSMGYGQQTHEALWTLYNKYRNDVAMLNLHQ